MSEKPTPRPTAETREFWEACNRSELLYQRCVGCGVVQSYPRAVCTGCHGGDLEYLPSAKRGRIATYTIVHRAPTAAFKADVPYALALVDLDEGFRLMMNVVDCEPERLEIGMAVRIVFEQRGPDNQQIPQAAPVEG